MCEKCGYSGCRHDWQKWDYKRYWLGYADYVEKKPFNGELVGPGSGYSAGWHDAKLDEARKHYAPKITQEGKQ